MVNTSYTLVDKLRRHYIKLSGLYDARPAATFESKIDPNRFDAPAGNYIKRTFKMLLSPNWQIDHLPPERQKLRKDLVAFWVDHFENMAMSPEMRAVWEAVKKGEKA